MTFTDEDLQLFKSGGDSKGPFLDHMYKLPALIARLEAAENCLHHVVSDKPRGDCTCLDDWRRAAGKE